MTGRNIYNRLLFQLQLFHCFNHQFTVSIFFYYNDTICSVCSESPMEAAWNRGSEGAIICGCVKDINTVI